MLLACIGLYGLLMYSVVQRTPELGLRMALGSRPAAIRHIVLKDSVATVVAGAVAGLCASWVLVRLVKTQLFALEPTDPVAFAAATLDPAVDRRCRRLRAGVARLANRSGHRAATGVSGGNGGISPQSQQS